MRDLDGIWYHLPEGFNENALSEGAARKNRPIEARTVIVDSYDPETAWLVSQYVPEQDREKVFGRLSHLLGEHQFFAAGRGRGYSVLYGGSLDSLPMLQNLFYLPFLGEYGLPNSIINASKAFHFNEEAQMYALMNGVPYFDANDENHVGLPLGRLRA